MIKKILMNFFEKKKKEKQIKDILDEIEIKILSILDMTFDYSFNEEIERNRHESLEHWKGYNDNIFIEKINKEFKSNITFEDIMNHYTIGQIINLIYFKLKNNEAQLNEK